MKVDDWAVCTENTEGEFTAGKAYKVRYVTTETVGVYEDDRGKENGWCREYFKPWQPKVGDRVRFTDKCLEFWWFGPHTKKKEGVIAGPSSWPGARGDFQFDVIVGGGSDVAYVSAEHIEPLPVAAEAQPAALQIEAGNSYRTRDGRKVGPMERDDWGDGQPWTCGERWYSDNGSWLGNGQEDKQDLIAEWVDEPAVSSDAVAVAATASNDNEPVASAKFKVGDVVTGNDCCGHPISGAITYVDENDNDLPYSIDGRWCTEAGIELATVAPQQSASTTGFTIPLADEEPANDNQVVVTLSLDADAFHEELDEIIAKLKKIRKLQRQTGLAA
ncbi:hypothetical protein GOB33_22370 [Sinorhizobium meliloti]|nr:hypothetical protein [Sinorhizobium meliloti]